jgi:hypothetical protein
VGFDARHLGGRTTESNGPSEPSDGSLDAEVASRLDQCESPEAMRALVVALPPSGRSAALHHLHRTRGNAFVVSLLGPSAPRHRDGVAADGVAADGVAADGLSPENVALDALRADPGTELPFQAQLQAAFGAHDVSSIRVHDSPAAERGAQAIGAAAYASGEHVALFGGGLREAAHEAAHVIQQRGRSRGSGVVEDASDEAHADAVADAVISGRSAEPLLDQVASPGTTATAGSIARIKDTKNGNARVDISSLREEQCYLYLQSSAMVPGTQWCGWEWEEGDREAIQNRFEQLKGGQMATLKRNLVSVELHEAAARREIPPGTIATFETLVDELSGSDKILNFESWFYGTLAFNVNDREKILDAINELRVAKARIAALPDGQKIDLAEQATGTKDYTADGTYDGAMVPTQYEVKTVREPQYDVSGISHQIHEALLKFESSPPGDYSVEVFAAYPTQSRTVTLGGDASRDEIPKPAEGTIEHVVKRNGVELSRKSYELRTEILKKLNRTWKTKGKARTVSVTMENGQSFLFTRDPAGGWT